MPPSLSLVLFSSRKLDCSRRQGSEVLLVFDVIVQNIVGSALKRKIFRVSPPSTFLTGHGENIQVMHEREIP